LAALFALASLSQRLLHYVWQNYLRKPCKIPYRIADYKNFTKISPAGCDLGIAGLAKPAHQARLFLLL
jgi:hypothetical protein